MSSTSNNNNTNTNNYDNKIYSASLKGMRNSNEDNEFILNNIDGHDPNIKDVNVFAIYDGHGNAYSSKYLKQVLPNYFIDKRIQYPLSKAYVMNVFDHIQKQLEKQSYAQHGGSTALIVIQYKQNNEMYLNIINLGDCRTILCRDNLAIPLTKEHRPHIFDEKNRIEQSGGKIIFDGYDWRIKDLSVSRAFGDIDAKPYVSHLPDLYRYKLDKNDKFIILGCDGLFEAVNSEALVNHTLIHCYEGLSGGGMNRVNKNINIAQKLCEYAIKRGSTDNVSSIVQFFD